MRGMIVGVMNLAGLAAPFWGHLADRRRLHRQVLLAGMLAALVALVLMPEQLSLPLKAALAGILGLGLPLPSRSWPLPFCRGLRAFRWRWPDLSFW
jgi:hypothetical protein